MNLFTVDVIKLPEHFKGRTLNGNEYIKGERREWTDGEVEWILKKKEEGYSYEQIAKATDRTLISVKTKIQKHRKKNDTYNEKHRDEKYETNYRFMQLIEPKTALDVYAGKGYWKDKVQSTVSNDKDAKFNHYYQMDALEFMCEMYRTGERFDLIDLDPYGSAYDSFDLAMKMATKGLIVSFGEWGHKRWRRYDFVEPRYGIDSQEKFTEEAFIKEIQRIGKVNKKRAIPIDSIKYENFFRVYFKLEPYKQTSQWAKE